MQPLERLDLQQLHTVSTIVGGMSSCSFGARMLGEAAHTLHQWIQAKRDARPFLVYDGIEDCPLAHLLTQMVNHKWFADVLLPAEFIYDKRTRGKNALIIGRYSERHEQKLVERAGHTIFINEFGMAPRGKTQDGYFPDVVFADPAFIMPILYFALKERMGIVSTNAIQLMGELKQFSGIAAEIAFGAETLYSMVTDPDCTVFMTLSGAMTVAKMSLLICDMIDRGMVQYISSTGALMAHGLIESVGLKHYKYDPSHDDATLATQGLNRVTDTLEPEENFTHIDAVINQVLDDIEAIASIYSSDHFGSWELHSAIGEYLHTHYPHERGILKSAYERDVPVVVPAFIDSEIGNDVRVHNMARIREGGQKLVMDMERDTEKLFRMALDTKRMGIFSIGGGVPRNNTQNVAPLIDIANHRLGEQFPRKKFSYGCRICPDAPYYGHMSGCTYSEGKSWGKMEFDGMFAEIRTDATLTWPFILKYVMDKMDK